MQRRDIGLQTRNIVDPAILHGRAGKGGNRQRCVLQGGLALLRGDEDDFHAVGRLGLGAVIARILGPGIYRKAERQR